jgi:hypothetical protein
MPAPTDAVTREQKEAFQRAQRPSSASRLHQEKLRALWPDIRQKLEAGWSVAEVWQELHRVVGLHCSLRTFYRAIKALSLAPSVGPAAAQDPGLVAAPAPTGWPKPLGEAPSSASRKSMTDLLNEPP